jgi:hypothetical protein
MTNEQLVLIVVAMALLFGYASWRWRRRPVRVRLIAMRLSDMVMMHPDQITRRCALCGEPVGIYPSGQAVMMHHPDAEIICQVCRDPGEHSALAPGAEFEPFQSVRRKP